MATLFRWSLPHKGRTIRFPGGVGSFQKKKNSPSAWGWKKKFAPVRGRKKKNHPCLWSKFFLKFSEKKILPREGDEKKNSAPVRGRKKKFPPYPNFLLPPWKSNGASLIDRGIIRTHPWSMFSALSHSVHAIECKHLWESLSIQNLLSLIFHIFTFS